MEDRDYIHSCLDLAHDYANKKSGCEKVKVGCLLMCRDRYDLNIEYSVLGSNIGIGYNCLKDGCRRIKLYGDCSKNHRLPSDCNSLHSEINAIANAAKRGVCTMGAVMFVTRYPCEACARAIVSAGIMTVYYGREQEISEYTKQILDAGGVEYYHVYDWKASDVEF